MKIVGKYNVDIEGLSYDGNNQLYFLVVLIKFNEKDEEIDRRILYFKTKNASYSNLPAFREEKEIEKYFKYKNYQKINYIK